MFRRFGSFAAPITVMAAMLAAAPGLAQTSGDATAATAAAQNAAAQALPAEGERDGEFSRRGFIATRADPAIRDAQGNVVWRLDAYDFVEGPAPDSVNPSLWRHMKHLRQHGLFEVSPNVWQVRGFDLANMTVVRGQTGWIVIDPLTSVEAASAAIELVNAQLGQRPVSAVIYSHSHADHFAGVRAVASPADAASGRVAVVAPEGFMDEASSENVLAGGAMYRRAAYQFASGMVPGPKGTMGSGIGIAVSSGTQSLIAPTDTIAHTGETRMIDGVEFEFQMVSGSEAPAEFNVYVAPERVFLAAEIATCTMHNILTPRGAKVRDARAWAGFLDQAARDYGPRSDVVISSHCWPIFGQDEGQAWLTAQRDNYRYLHDQTIRLMNRGATMDEIAEALALPPALAPEWSTHGYYGTYSHNAKAIYQFYLGWYDAVPAHLNPHPPVERARRLVAALGGADKALEQARTAFDGGDYRWSSDLLQSIVFAEPDNAAARALLANSYEQQGFQAESAIWRNQFLAAARDLRGGSPIAAARQSPDLIAAIPTALLLDSVATRYDPGKLGRENATIRFEITDRDENALIEAGRLVLIGRTGDDAGEVPADVTLRGPRQLMLAALFLKQPVVALKNFGLEIEGDAAAAQAVIDALDPLPGSFAIVEP